MIPQITKENGKVKVEGNYEFTRSENLIYDGINGIPVHMELTFKHSPELPDGVSYNEAIELIGERLKQDFIAAALSDGTFKNK